LYEQLTATAISPEKFALVIGSPRSGTTIIGAIIDSHPKMLCANESSASEVFWRDMGRLQILDNIIDNCRQSLSNNRPSAGYFYGIKTSKKDCHDIAVIGDKIWNAAVLPLAGQRNLLASLQNRTGAKIAVIACLRNPFDVIATMHRRTGASLRNRFGWYAMHCEAIRIIIDRGEQPILLLRHEELLERPHEICRQLFEWLGYPTTDEHLNDIRARVLPKPHQTRFEVDWTADNLTQAFEKLFDRYAFLRGYAL
jgi:hypothetical protein